jgi:chromosome segregation ATPase
MQDKHTEKIINGIHRMIDEDPHSPLGDQYTEDIKDGLNHVFDVIESLETQNDDLRRDATRLSETVSEKESEIASINKDLEEYQHLQEDNHQSDNLQSLVSVVINPFNQSIRDQLSLKALANLFRNLTLEELEAIDDQKRLEFRMKKRTYITYP